MELSEQQIERYSRQIILDEIGGVGQKKLLQARVLVVGSGGLGSPAAYYLAAAGVGTLGILDSDKVELNNLQRQILHSTKKVGWPKVESARETLQNLNPEIKIVPHHLRLTSENARQIIREYDYVLDGSDNFPTRYLVNDTCVLEKKPLVHAGILRFDGQAMTILPGQGPCYRCLFASPPPPGLVPNCQQAGVIGVVAGLLGIIQAAEVIKLILGIGDLLVGRLLVINLLEMSFRYVQVRKNPQCPICGENPTIKELIDYEEFCAVRSR